MSPTVEVVDQAAANARERERDRIAWNLPVRPAERDSYVAPIQSDLDKRLDWESFSARYFPGSRRHDLRAIVAYAAYKRSSPEGSETGEPADSMIREEGGAQLRLTT